MPGGPSSTTLRASVRNAPEASAATCWRTPGWASKSKSSRVLRAGNPAARMRSWAPEALRADDFAFEHGGEVVLVGPAGVAGLVGQPGGGFGDPGRLQRGGEVVDLLDRVRRWLLSWRPSRDLPAVDEPERAVVVGQIPGQIVVGGRGRGAAGTARAAAGGLRRGRGR